VKTPIEFMSPEIIDHHTLLTFYEHIQWWKLNISKFTEDINHPQLLENQYIGFELEVS